MSISPNRIPPKKLEKIWAQVPPDYYDQGIKKNLLQKLWHTKKLNQIINYLPKDKNTKYTILDVGCSSGILTAEVANTLPKSKVIGLDSYKKAIEFAKGKYPKISFIAADAHKIPMKNKTVDILICTETLEHVVDPKEVLVEMKRVLKKDGQAIISMDSGSLLFRTIWYLWTKSKGKVWENAHLHEFTAKLLEDLIKETGFKIKKKEISHLGMAITFLAVPKNIRDKN